MTQAVQAWADGFGNWHALITEEFPLEAHKLAKQAIADELRARDAGFDGEGFSVTRIYAKGNQTEFVEYWEHDPMTIRSGVAECGTCGRLFPDIYPSARCPFEYEHASSLNYTDARLATQAKVTDVPRKGQTVSGYGGAVPTRYMLKYAGYWRRVYAMAYGNSATLYVKVKGEDFIINDATAVLLEELA